MRIYSLLQKSIQNNNDNPIILFKNLTKLNTYLKSQNTDIFLDETQITNSVSCTTGTIIYEDETINIKVYEI